MTARSFDAVLSELDVQIKAFDLKSNDRCFVTLTFAQALDGSIAAGRGGAPLRLSSEESMIMTHQLRAVHDGILVGIGTVLADNPSLNTRLCEGPSPRPIILDSDLRCPPTAKLIHVRKDDKSDQSRPIIVSSGKRLKCSIDPLVEHERAHRKSALEKEGCVIIEINGGDFNSLFQRLRQELNVKRVMIEGGAKVIRSCLMDAQDVIDTLIMTIAPTFVGGLVPTHPWDATRPPLNIKICTCAVVGGDVVICGKINDESEDK